jgi:hypothetical protein
VQGEVFDLSDPAAPQSLNQAFLAGKKHLLKVWLGKLEAGAIAAPQPIQLHTLPDQPSWELEVYFWEPNHAPAVQIQPLTVYRKQDPQNPLNICEFTFTPRADIPTFQGRLAVVYKQNILQMLFLEGKVVADAAAGANDAIQFKWAEIKGVRSPEQLEEFDLVFYNESDPLQGAGLMFFGGEAGLKQVNGLEAGIQDMISMLKEAGQPALQCHAGADWQRKPGPAGVAQCHPPAARLRQAGCLPPGIDLRVHPAQPRRQPVSECAAGHLDRDVRHLQRAG